MQKIKLTRNKETVVDDEDYEYLNQFKWHCSATGYALRSSSRVKGKQTPILIHRLIMKCPKNMEVDHINGDRLDNRKENLRTATREQNACNRKKYSITSSKYKGLCFNKSNNKWIASIQVSSKNIYLGSFENEIDAAIAYNKAAVAYFGKFAQLNEIKIDN